MSTGVFPVHWKVSTISPLHKNKPIYGPENYRPLNQTSILARLTERIFDDQLINFLTTDDLTGEYQHGFRKRISRNPRHFAFFDW